jgi:hypothetical protein
LRAAEFEHLMERSWYAVTETCLAFTVFKWVDQVKELYFFFYQFKQQPNLVHFRYNYWIYLKKTFRFFTFSIFKARRHAWVCIII